MLVIHSACFMQHVTEEFWMSNVCYVSRPNLAMTSLWVKFPVISCFNCRYDPTTGIFTVPPGGDGLYYFSTYLLVYDGELGWFNIRVDGVILCTARGDYSNNGAYVYAQATCSGLIQLSEGGCTQYSMPTGNSQQFFLNVSFACC